MSVAITFFRQSVQRGKLPFEVLGDPFYSESNIRELDRRAHDTDAQRNIAEHDLIAAEESVHA